MLRAYKRNPSAADCGVIGKSKEPFSCVQDKPAGSRRYEIGARLI